MGLTANIFHIIIIKPYDEGENELTPILAEPLNRKQFGHRVP